MSAPWTAFYWGDYGSKTDNLTQGEHGAYLLLLKHYYTSGGPIPASADFLTTRLPLICRAFADHEKAAASKVLAQFFELRDGHYHHDRCDEELSIAASIQQAGAKGGQARSKSLSAERRSEIAKQAAGARWKTKDLQEVMPSEMLSGCLADACYSQPQPQRTKAFAGNQDFKPSETSKLVQQELGLSGQQMWILATECVEKLCATEGLTAQAAAEEIVSRWRAYESQPKRDGDPHRQGKKGWLESGGYLRKDAVAVRKPEPEAPSVTVAKRESAQAKKVMREREEDGLPISDALRRCAQEYQ